MIDLEKDDLLSMADVAAKLPKNRGRSISAVTVWRWCRHGFKVGRERVKLECVQVGRTRVTTWEAVQAFFAAIGPQEQSQRQTPAQRRRKAERVRKQLEEAGIL